MNDIETALHRARDFLLPGCYVLDDGRVPHEELDIWTDDIKPGLILKYWRPGQTGPVETRFELDEVRDVAALPRLFNERRDALLARGRA